MNIDRAKQIFDSYGVIEVFHNGNPVWIENISGKNVEVSYLGMEKRAEVHVENLVEGSVLQ